MLETKVASFVLGIVSTRLLVNTSARLLVTDQQFCIEHTQNV